MLDQLATAVVVLDRSLAARQINPAAEALLGVSARTVSGRALTEWLPGAAQLEPRLHAALDDRQPWTARELTLAVGSGLQPVVVDLTVSPVTAADDDGLVLEFTGMDRHLRISREESLQSQQAASAAVIRGIAHEIKNPLGGIRGAAQLLQRRGDDPDLHRYTEVIISEVDRLAALVDDMLGPARPPARLPVNVHAITERVAALIDAEFPGRDAVVRDYDPSIPELRGDADQLTQALLNLVRNATHHAPPGTTVTLRTRIARQVTIGGRRHRLAVCIDVIDHGEGVPPDMQERIFFPMVTTRADGNGLGLPVAQSLVARHGGLVECVSEPGHTLFSMILPVETDDND